jgi:hypothetical protein
MDWQTIKLLLKAFAPLAVIFYLIVIFGLRLFAEEKEDDI